MKSCVILVLGVALSACAPANDGADRDGGTSNAASAAADLVFNIVASDQGFTAPDSVPAGLRHIVFTNHGKKVHESMFIKLPEGMDASGFIAAVQSGVDFPKGTVDYNGPGLLSPGDTTEQWLRLDPGRYILMCWNEDFSKLRDLHTITVTEAGRHDDAPHKENTVLTLRDFRFEFSTPLKSGVQVVKVVNAGPSMHEVDFYRQFTGKTMADTLAWRQDDAEHAPTAYALGGVLDSHDIRREVWIRREFLPGHYVLQCEMPMTVSSEAVDKSTPHANHTDAGMTMEFEVR